MKKTFLVIAVIFSLFAASCTDKSPSGIAKTYYRHIQKGDYEKAFKVMFPLSDYSSETERDGDEDNAGIVFARSFLKAIIDAMADDFNSKGGLKSFKIISEDISEDGNTAIVEFKLIYGNKEVETGQTEYVKRDGVWGLKMPE
jgi:hypothetical protein